MVRYRRNYLEGGSYFFTVTLADRRSTALVDHAGALRDSFRRTRADRPFGIDAIVVLPDHLHAILTLPPDESDFSDRWRRIKGHFTRQVGRTGVALEQRSKGEYGLWQRRFWEHTIRNDEDFARHVDYIHYNPVKHGHVARVRDWPLSSFHVYVRRGVLPADWAGTAGASGGRYGEP